MVFLVLIVGPAIAMVLSVSLPLCKEEVFVMLEVMRFQMALRGLPTVAFLLGMTALMLFAVPSFALITGGTGNEPIRDPGWPAGAEEIFNNPARVAHWEGPPFGGGQYHAECRGDTKTFQAVLDDFARLDVKTKELILHDGIGHSFWLNPNRKGEKRAESKIDWVFMVWIPDHWKRLRRAPVDLNPTNPNDAKSGPPSTVDLYTGGNVHFSELVVPKGITVIDKRMQAHGFSPDDGTVIEGTVVDCDTKEPIAANVLLERITSVPKKGYEYSVVVQQTADKQGHWVLKKVPAGWFRVVIKSGGYAPRVVGYFRPEKQPRWHECNSQLARAASVSGLVTDASGKPLANVDVRLSNVAVGSTGRYNSPNGYSTQTDIQGKFVFDDVPVGKASVRVHKQGYCRPGLGPKITIPAKDVTLKMKKSAQLVVTVDFSETERPKAYIVNIEQKGGPAVGKWGGSALINEKNQVIFKNVPPGKYFLQGHPNPTREDQKTDPIPVELSGGEEHRMTLVVQ